MPTYILDGFEVMIYTRSEAGHRPHVHVFYGDGELVVLLSPLDERDNRGMKVSDARKVMGVIKKYREFLLKEWDKYHA